MYEPAQGTPKEPLETPRGPFSTLTAPIECSLTWFPIGSVLLKGLELRSKKTQGRPREPKGGTAPQGAQGEAEKCPNESKERPGVSKGGPGP